MIKALVDSHLAHIGDDPEHVGLLTVGKGIEIEGVTTELTVIVIEFDVAGEPVIHVAFEVMMQVITFPLVRVDDE